MTNTQKPVTMIKDFVSGHPVPDVGAEENRQAVEKLLVVQKGYLKSDIEVDAPMVLSIAGESYTSALDLLVRVNGRPFMAMKCAAGSLGSRQREIVAAARLFDTHQIPLAVVSDGEQAIVFDTASGTKIGETPEAIPTREVAQKFLESFTPIIFPEDKIEREKLIFRTYDLENINVRRKVGLP